MRSVVSVWARWGDYVLGVCDVRPGQALSVGSPPRRLVRFRDDGAWCSLPSADVDVERALSVGQTVTLERDGLQYSVTCSEVEDAATFGTPRPWLAPLGGVAVASALVTALALLFVPTLPVVGHIRAPTPVQRGAPRLAALPDRLSVRVERFAEAAEPQPRLLKPPGDLRCGDAEMGAMVADARHRYGVSGPKDNADPHLARPVEGVGYPTSTAFTTAGWLGVARALSGSRAPTPRWGRDAALGTDPVDARGNMWGDAIADAAGESGLGLAASPGGVVKRIDVAPVAENAMAALRVVHSGLRVDGGRKASEIGRAMATRFDEFRLCAEAAQLAEARQVQVEFDVGADGHASTTGAETGRLEQCLDESVARIAFAPEANAQAHVVYPLYFVPATAGLRMPPAEQRARAAPCDCGG